MLQFSCPVPNSRQTHTGDHVSNIKENLPGDVNRHLLIGSAGQHTEQLVQNGGKELDHHMTLHGVKTLRATMV